MKRRTIAICLALMLAFSMLFANVSFADTSEAYWTDTLTDAPATGYTEDGNVITVTTAEGLAWISVRVSGLNGVTKTDFSGKTVKLGANIDLSGKKWTPIGSTSSKVFKGVFDGQNYTVSNIKIDSTETNVGFFGYVGGGIGTTDRSEIKNLKLSNVNLTVSADRRRSAGAFVGNYSAPYGKISNCSVTGKIICTATADVASKPLISGGFAGTINPVTNPETPPAAVVENCTADVDISGKNAEAGGFVGKLNSNGEIKNCAALGDVEISNVKADVYAGGFIAEFDSGNGPVAVKKSCATGKVDAQSSSSYMYVGGFAGANAGGAYDNIFEECMTSSDVTSNSTESSAMNLAGGFIGAAMSNVKIGDCYCTGDVSATGGTYEFGGGFAGYCISKIERSYCVGNVKNTNAGSDNRAYAFCPNVNASTNMDNCFALGEEMNADAVSGFISTTAEGSFTNLAYFGAMNFNGKTPKMSGHSAAALTAAQVGSTQTYASFEDSVWKKEEGKLPVLKAISETVQATIKPVYLYKKTAELSLEAPEEMVYNGNTYSFAFNVAGISAKFDGSTVEPKGYIVKFYDGSGNSVNAENLVNAGNYNAEIAVDPTDEQYWGRKTIPFEIKKSKIKITVKDIETTVGNAPPAIPADGYTVTGLAAGDSLKTEPTLSYETQPDMQTAGEVKIKATGAELYENANYESDIEYIDGKLKITAAAVSGGGGTSRCTVKFNANGGSAVSAQTVRKNNVISEPKAPVKTGYTFGGWYTDAKLTDEYDFSAKVTKSFTLYAKWTEDNAAPDDENKDDTNAGDTDNKTDGDTPTDNTRKNPFVDVKENDWYFDYVKYVNENGLMTGITSNTFAPNDTVTRGMFATVLYRLAGEPAVNRSVPFADVSANMYYANAVIWAEQNDIAGGYSETEFAPDDFITREQIAAILYRYAKLKGYDVTEGGMRIREFEDYETISDYALTALTWAVNTGLINGKTETLLCPRDNATRAEIAAILKRFSTINK